MEKRFQAIDGMVNVTIIIPLEDKQLEILECPNLRKAIDKIARECKLDWAVETSGNMSQAALSHLCGPVIGELQAHEIEMTADAFMSKISELKVSRKKNCPSHEEAEVIAERVSFCREILEDMHDTEHIHVIGANLRIGKDPQLPLPMSLFSTGYISYGLLMEMIELYLDKYDHE